MLFASPLARALLIGSISCPDLITPPLPFSSPPLCVLPAPQNTLCCVRSMEGAAVGRLTPFMLFYTEHRDAVKARINTHSSSRATTPPLSQDISREICRLWQLLTPQQTKEYCLLSNLYAESLSKFGSRRSSGGNASAGGRQAKNANNSSSGGSSSSRSRRKKDARLSGLPKPAVSSFMWFSRHHRAILRTENREMTFSDIGKAVGVLWKSATDEQKRPFDDLSTEVCV